MVASVNLHNVVYTEKMLNWTHSRLLRSKALLQKWVVCV